MTLIYRAYLNILLGGEHCQVAASVWRSTRCSLAIEFDGAAWYENSGHVRAHEQLLISVDPDINIRTPYYMQLQVTVIIIILSHL